MKLGAYFGYGPSVDGYLDSKALFQQAVAWGRCAFVLLMALMIWSLLRRRSYKTALVGSLLAGLATLAAFGVLTGNPMYGSGDCCIPAGR